MKRENFNKIRFILHNVGGFFCFKSSYGKNIQHRGATLKKQQGITLIALIITIILMLILAGIAINMAFGKNGLFLIAQTAVEKTAVAELKEKANIEYASLKVQNYEAEVKLSQVINELKNQEYKIVTKANAEGESRITGITVTQNPLILDIGKTR